MVKFIDRSGERFGRLVVVERVGRDNFKKVLWKCRCDCGKEACVSAGSLVTGNTTSCGCYLKEKNNQTRRLEKRFLQHVACNDEAMH